MRQRLGFIMLLLGIFTSSNGVAGTQFDFQVTHREQSSLRGLVHTVQEAEAEIRHGHVEPRRRLCETTYTLFGYVKEYIFYTVGPKANEELIEREALTYSPDELNLPSKVEQLSTSTYKNQRQDSVYTLLRDADGRLTDISMTTTDAASPIFNGQTWRTTYRYDQQGRLTEKASWIEVDGAKRPDTVKFLRYVPQPDGMLIEEIGHEGRWKGKVVQRIWWNSQGRKVREYSIDPNGHVVEKCFYVYNDHGDIAKQSRVWKAGQTTVTYRYIHYDAQGNWTERIESWSRPGVAKGASIPHRATYRTYKYYDIQTTSVAKTPKAPDSRQAEVQIVVTSYSPENGTEPMEKLFEALEKDPNGNLFRVTWHHDSFTKGIGSAVYNRKERTVKYWCDVHTPEYRDVEHCLVLHVSADILQQIVHEKKGTASGTDGAFFDMLYKYGCERQGYRHIHRDG